VSLESTRFHGPAICGMSRDEPIRPPNNHDDCIIALACCRYVGVIPCGNL